MGDLPWLLDLGRNGQSYLRQWWASNPLVQAKRIHTALTGIRFAAWYHGRLVQPAAALDKNRE
jgi:hypothetical protein